MALHIMPGVNLRGLQSQALLALTVAIDAFGCQGYDCILTCAKRDGPFSADGYHSTGQAIDLSVRMMSGDPIPDEAVSIILAQLNAVLGRPGGGQYDVVDERPGHSPSPQSTGAHIHIEFDPK